MNGRPKLTIYRHAAFAAALFLFASFGSAADYQRTPRLEVVFTGEALERDSLNWLRRHDERSYSFVDATSFALMRSLGIREALAFDGDFAAAGFVELRAAE